MNKKLLDIFSRIDNVKPLNLHYNSKVLIIDGINTFLRSFAVINQHNYYGNHVGGLTGFLKSVGSAIKHLNPTRCIIVFDGEGGSVNRKYLYPEYKANRNTPRLINYKSFDNKQDENSAKYDEIVRLIDYLDCLPVLYTVIDKLEADDVIGYLCKNIYADFDDSEIYVMSTDTDFYQLINDRTFVYSPTKKVLLREKDVIELYNVHPCNYSIYKSLVGDTSDNIPGINGLGEKNTPMLFENLVNKNPITLDNIYELCKNPPKKSILYERVLNMKKMLDIFYKIIDLKDTIVLEDDLHTLTKTIYTKPDRLKKQNFIQLIKSDKISDPILNSEHWINLFSILNQ